MYKTAVKFIICSAMLSGVYATETGSDSTDSNAELSQQVTKLQKDVSKFRAGKEPENFLGLNRKGAYSSSAVTTSPTLGLRSKYKGEDLVVNFSTMNEDVRLLEQRAEYQKQRSKDELSKPLLELSGVVRGTLSYARSIEQVSNADVNLSDVELDGFAEINRMVSGYFSLAYDDGEPGYSVSSIDAGNGHNRVDWSNVSVKRGFITVGDFTQSNWYGSIGQMYVPFGKYSSFQLSSTLTSLLGKTRGRAMDIGYRTKDMVATAYAMKGTSYVGEDNPAINTWGFNIQKNAKLADDRSITFGAGYTNNIAESDGILDALDTLHHGTHRYQVVHYMPAYDVYAKVSGDNWIFNAEYIHANADLAKGSNTYGQPAALQLEIDRMFNLGTTPASIAFGYGHMSDFDMIAKDSYAVTLNTYMFKDTVQSLEFRHLSASTASDVEHTVTDKNSITAMFSVYF